MIVRTWRGWAEPARRHAYVEHFERRVLPSLAGLEGFQGAELLVGEGEGRIEYLVLTRWASRDAIAAFAVGDADRAVVEPEAAAALAEYERGVRHYEVVAGSI